MQEEKKKRSSIRYVSNRRQGTTKYVLGMCTGKEHLFIFAPVCLKERKILLHSWHGISNGRNISSCIVPSLILSWGGISYQINDCSKRNLNSLYPVFSHLSSWEDDAFCPFLSAELWLSSWIEYLCWIFMLNLRKLAHLPSWFQIMSFNQLH